MASILDHIYSVYTKVVSRMKRKPYVMLFIEIVRLKSKQYFYSIISYFTSEDAGWVQRQKRGTSESIST